MTDLDVEGRVREEFEADGRSVIFRYPKPDDVAQFIPMHDTLTAEQVMCTRFSFTPATAASRIQEMLRAIRGSSRRDILVEVDGTLCGYGHAQRSGYKYCTVGLALVSAVRGIGIGTALMRHLEKESRELGAERLYLDVWSANPAAIRVYTNLGYREVGRRPGWLRLDNGEEADLIEMVKPLT